MITIHVDIDNFWMYEKEFGVSINPDPEYIYKESLPVFLKLLKKYHSHATFMIVGKDLKLPACQDFCQKAIAAGHEIGNHTWSHPIAFGKLSYEEKKREILKTHQLIKNVCETEPVGFRGPGYYQDKEIITILKKLNYQYDSTVLPGFASLLMSSYARLRGEKNKEKTFGRLDYLIKQDKPYFIESLVSNQTLLELPLSVLPFVRLPIHTTFAYFFGSSYRRLIFKHLKSKKSYLMYLCHAVDFVNLGRSYPNHPVIPFRYTFEERMELIETILKRLVQINGEGLKTTQEILNKKGS